MKSFNKTETPFSTCKVFFVSKGNLLDFYSDMQRANKALKSYANKEGPDQPARMYSVR